jgi:2-oxoisovalerate dehydrogenase E1 component
MVHNTLKAAEEAGIDAEVIDVRNLDHFGMDWGLIGDSIAKTGRVLIAEQTGRPQSLGTRWIGEIQSRFFDYLDYEILHVTGSLSAPTVSAVLNKAALANADDVRDALSTLAATG